MMYSYIRFDTQYAVWISCRANVAPKSTLIQLGSAHEWSGVWTGPKVTIERKTAFIGVRSVRLWCKKWHFSIWLVEFWRQMNLEMFVVAWTLCRPCVDVQISTNLRCAIIAVIFVVSNNRPVSIYNSSTISCGQFRNWDWPFRAIKFSKKIYTTEAAMDDKIPFYALGIRSSRHQGVSPPTNSPPRKSSGGELAVRTRVK